MPIDRMEAFRQAVIALGDASAEQLCSFIQARHGLRIEPKFIPFFWASLRDLENLTRLRQQARAALALPERPPEASSTALAAGPERLHEVRRLALQLMETHGLHNWSFAYNRRKRSLGLCVYERRAIELSRYFVERNEHAEVLDTILHEIAHALVGPGHAHDAVWKRKCREIGARPARCGDAEMPAGRWKACCGSCGQTFERHRKPQGMRGWFCIGCGPQRGKLSWQQASA
jgi:predicted SprT family Zn-dependent metalloprotease